MTNRRRGSDPGSGASARTNDLTARADELQRALHALPLFPLPGTVFFPHTLLPLHVFEPRYRQMTEHVLASHQHLGVVCTSDAGVDGNDGNDGNDVVGGNGGAGGKGGARAGGSAVRGVAKVAGVGRVVHHERLADGRFHILLQGVARAELVEELAMDGVLYRRAAARIAECDDGDDGDAEAALEEVRTLRSCYARLLEACPETKDTLGDLPLRVQEPRVLADVVCAAVLEDVSARQAALEETSVARRLRCANDALATLLLQSLATETARMH